MPLKKERMQQRARPFPPRVDYASLSVKDLLDARDAYHTYLSLMPNVVATAVGRYLIHRRDWYATHPPYKRRPRDYPKNAGEARTLANSVIRPWSWPAVLVFVRNWQEPRELAGRLVPQTLYLPDGRIVPTCVVEARPDERKPDYPGPFYNSTLLGGGYSCFRMHQGEDSAGTFACLVKKSGSYYALTSRHVAGGEGESVRSRVRGQWVKVGTTSNMGVDRVLMSDYFPRWAGPQMYLTGDAGLVHIEDIQDWTSQAYGIGEIGEMFNATESMVTLDLIGCPVRAFGGASGVIEGEIKALFFRYQSMGIDEHATEVLIGSQMKNLTEAAKPFTRPGDSGTIWFYDPSPEQAEAQEDFPEAAAPVDRGRRARRLRPVAMQWGGERFVSADGTSSAYALASFLSTVCRALDVEVVRDWSTGHDEYWGKIGHFAIGWKACDVLDQDSPLGKLMARNQARIGFDDSELKKGAEFRQGRDRFVPLADVPDYVWIGMRGARQYEAIQHFADVDIYDIHGGQALIDACVQDANTNLRAKRWKEYFDGFAKQQVGPDPGCLPFRVWQIWEEMVGYLKEGDVLRFVAAAGVMGHYVGDASQPLHCSYLHHGHPPMKTVGGRKYPIRKEDKEEYDAWKKTRPAKVHAIYEEGMLEFKDADNDAALEALEGVNKKLHKHTKKPRIETGFDAARQTILLMDRSRKRLSPEEIIAADDPALTAKQRGERLWENKHVKDGTIESLAESVRLLAALWEAAWRKGHGDQLPKSKLVVFPENQLEQIYRRDRKFVPSMSLDQMVSSGRF